MNSTVPGASVRKTVRQRPGEQTTGHRGTMGNINTTWRASRIPGRVQTRIATIPTPPENMGQTIHG